MVDTPKPQEQLKTRFFCKKCNKDGDIDKCIICGSQTFERLKTGELLQRVDAPSYIVEDILKIFKENNTLTDTYIMQTEQHFNLARLISQNIDRRVHLQGKLKNTIENGIRKLRLHKEKGVRWGYDPNRKQFVGTMRPPTGQVQYKEGGSDGK